jgi:hypothetical protein
MKSSLITTFFLMLALITPTLASYREHKHFGPNEAGAVTKELIDTLKQLKADFPEAVLGRAILTKRPGVGVGVRISLKKNEQIELTFDLACERKVDGYIDSSQEGIDDRRTIVFRPVIKPEFAWHLSDDVVAELEKKLNTPASNMWDYTLYHEILYSEATEDILQSNTRITVRVWTVKEAVDLVTSYYSRHPKDTSLWEDG